MRRAWVCGGDTPVAAEMWEHLDELGYSPQRARDHEPAEVVAALSAAAAPELVVVAGGGGRAGLAPTVALAAALRGAEALAAVPLLVALHPAALAAATAWPGGDELVVVPVTVDELRLRIERARERLGLAAIGDVVVAGTLALNLATYETTIDGRPIELTPMEYQLLRFLATHPDRVFSRDALLERVWGYDFFGSTRTVDVHVRRVRAKLGTEHARRIQTVRSVGYRFAR